MTGIQWHHLPGEKALAAIPLWPRITYAVRCAQLAAPLYGLGWSRAKKKHVKQLTSAVEAVAEIVFGPDRSTQAIIAASGSVDRDVFGHAWKKQALTSAATAQSLNYALSAMFVFGIGGAFVFGKDGQNQSATDGATTRVAQAAQSAWVAMVSCGDPNSTIHLLVRDYERLREACPRLSDDSVIDQGLFERVPG